jgi:hypothetical protein
MPSYYMDNIVALADSFPLLLFAALSEEVVVNVFVLLSHSELIFISGKKKTLIKKRK